MDAYIEALEREVSALKAIAHVQTSEGVSDAIRAIEAVDALAPREPLPILGVLREIRRNFDERALA